MTRVDGKASKASALIDTRVIHCGEKSLALNVRSGKSPNQCNASSCGL